MGKFTMAERNRGPDPKEILRDSAKHVVESICSLCTHAKEGLRYMVSQPRVLCMSVIIACFEGSMYAFVFNWTPALENVRIPPPHGLIFSLFMMACMCSVGLDVARRLDDASLQVSCSLRVELDRVSGGYHLHGRRVGRRPSRDDDSLPALRV